MAVRLRLRALVLGLALGLSAVAFPPAGREATADGRRVHANGWRFTVKSTPTDGLAVTSARYKGHKVFQRLSVPQIRVFYSVNPTMNDQLGGRRAANVPIHGPIKVGFGNSVIDVRARYSEDWWPSAASYRYDVRYLFYADGRFRARVYAYGPGLEPKHTYAVDFRLDLDLRDRGDEFYRRFLDGDWREPRRECSCIDEGSHDAGAEWLLYDGSSARGYRVLPNPSDGHPYLYGLRYRNGQGNDDLPWIRHPWAFKNNEPIRGRNVVLWYRAFARYERPNRCPGRCKPPIVIGPTFKPTIVQPEPSPSPSESDSPSPTPSAT
ncbi:MAG TPA: hypothetical protein VGB83_00655 [Actinomycetota bacterium]